MKNSPLIEVSRNEVGDYSEYFYMTFPFEDAGRFGTENAQYVIKGDKIILAFYGDVDVDTVKGVFPFEPQSEIAEYRNYGYTFFAYKIDRN